MFDGSVKRVEDIIVGDMVMGPDQQASPRARHGQMLEHAGGASAYARVLVQIAGMQARR